MYRTRVTGGVQGNVIAVGTGPWLLNASVAEADMALCRASFPQLHAGTRRTRQQSALAVLHVALHIPQVRPSTDDPRLGNHSAFFHRTKEIDLQLDRRERLAFDQGGSISIAHRRVRQVAI